MSPYRGYDGRSHGAGQSDDHERQEEDAGFTSAVEDCDLHKYRHHPEHHECQLEVERLCCVTTDEGVSLAGCQEHHN